MKYLNKAFVFFSLTFILVGFCNCGKARLFGTQMEVNPVSKSFPVEPGLALKSAKEALAFYGYNLQKEDAEKGMLETHWQPTTSDSHYVSYFDKQDRGTVGAYHKLVVKVTSKGQGSQVEVSSVAQSFVNNLLSTQIEEHKVLNKIADFTRRQEVEVTNIGLQ
ncbi:MAG: hypothetical protein HQM15_11120 [Deltaproteobacteria bacterium]|nr:hypothetical protein [Deltaproteobacteria bacterium]